MEKSARPSLQEVLRQAHTMPPQDRLNFVRDACSDDEALYASAVRELHSRQQWFDDSDGQGAETSIPRPDITNERIGPYRIVRSLGEGGMGEVFLAHRADNQFDQQVAIKVVRRGLLSRQVEGRLRLERQILAGLDHPNIARLFDGGSTSDGTPYIVMEYVAGEPIDSYCDRRYLPVAQRLRLFQTVCSAVHRAHQNLVVHRDLKPSNILVTHDGVPKLLDFGIAKMLDDRQMLHTMAVTQADFRMMTPDHASPEQFRGEPVTTASDIYVLGVLLYELLCGYRPFVLKGNRLAELERAICEDAVIPPSVAIAAAATSDPSGVEQISSARNSTPARLRKALTGDLDNIVTMALRKEPERRYLSVEQFAADVGRYLEGMPVVARADAWSYRAGKFMRRHVLGVAAAAAFIAVLVGFTITTLVQSRQIERQRDIAEAERERAEAVSDFLVDSFRLADPTRARGDTITARDILDGGAVRISTELRNQPALQATLLDTIGSVYLSLGQPSHAQPLIEQGLTIRRSLFGNDSLDVAESLSSLNAVYRESGDLQAAEKLAIEGLEIHRRLTGPTSKETATSLCQLGAINYQKGDLSKAGELFQQCLDMRVALLGRSHELVTGPLDNLARLAQDRQDFATAERLYREVLAIDRTTHGERHPRYVRHLHNLATATHDQGNLASAEALYRQAVALYRDILGEDHPETIDAMSSMGRLLVDQGKLDEARTAFESVVAANARVRPNHPYAGHDLARLARLAIRQKRFAEAEAHLTKALEIYAVTLPPGHRFIAAARTSLGRAYVESGKPQLAETQLRQALDTWTREYGQGSALYAQARASLGKAWAMQGRTADAEQALLESYPVLVASSRTSDKEMASEVRQWIEDLYRSQNRPQAAAEYFAKVPARTRTL